MSFGRYSVNHPRTYDPVMTTLKAAFRDVWKSSIALPFETNDVKAAIVRPLLELVENGTMAGRSYEPEGFKV